MRWRGVRYGRTAVLALGLFFAFALFAKAMQVGAQVQERQDAQERALELGR